MTLRVIYRSYGGENRKGRPGYYSKLLALASFLRAAEPLDVDIVYLNDGPIPDDRLRLMRKTGRLVGLPGVGMRGSYRAALEHATDGRWAPDDIVWFSEDDYLYLPTSLDRLQRVATALTDVDYFALYGSTPSWQAKRDDEPDAHRPAGWYDAAAWEVDGQHWARLYSTTSTFGARVGPLTEDMGVFRFCMVPHRNMLRDHDTGLVLQGFAPYSYRELSRALLGRTGSGPRERLREAALAPFHVATNLRAHRRHGRRRLLVVADPNLATHMEIPLESAGQDWAQAARATAEWAEAQGLVDVGALVR